MDTSDARQEDRAAGAAGTGGTRPVDRPIAAAVRSYVGHICEPNSVVRVERTALSRIAEVPEGADLHAAVRSITRTVVLEDVAVAGRGFAPRLKRLVRRRRGCLRVPALVKRRADGDCTVEDLRWLYSHLNSCPDCAVLAARLNTAEWQLGAALGHLPSRAPRPATNGMPERDVQRAAPPTEPASLADPQPQAPPLARVKRSTQRPKPASDANSRIAPVPRPLTRPAARPVRRRFALGGGLLGAAAVAAVVVAATSGGGHTGAVASRAAPGGVVVATHGVRTPFAIAGGRWTVFVSPKQPWTSFTSRNAGTGLRWEPVEILARGLTAGAIDPRALHPRLQDATGRLYFADRSLGTAGSRPSGPLAVGVQTQADLAFRVAANATGLTLLFSPTKTVRVVVQLSH
jgi:hypothetical protein